MSKSHFSFGKATTIAAFSTAFLSAAIAPFATLAPAQAQLFPTQTNRNSSSVYQRQQQTFSRTVTIPTGTEIPVVFPDAERVIVSPDERIDLTVEVAANLRDRNGRILIPYGAEIEGEIRPVDGGSQFIADRLIFSETDDTRLYAESEINDDIETIEEGTDAGEILKGAAIGAGAATIIALITGDRSLSIGEILIGGGLGAVGGLLLGGDDDEVIAFDSDRDLNLVLSERLSLQPDSFRTAQSGR